MDAVLDDITFLANSVNRVAVFETLVEAPRSRDEIRGAVDLFRSCRDRARPVSLDRVTV